MKTKDASADHLPPTTPPAPRQRLLKIASCLLVVILAVGLAACPQQPDNTAQLQAEVARLKAEADSKTKADMDSAAAKAQAAQTSAAADAQAAASAQAQTAADVAKAEAEVAKAQAEADEAAKSAAAAQTSFVEAQGEADKAKEVVDTAKTEAAESQKAAAEPTATEADVAKAEADANELALEVAKAESARLRAELARAKVRAAGQRITHTISATSNFWTALATALLPSRGGTVYSIAGLGAMTVLPGTPGGPFTILSPPYRMGLGVTNGITRSGHTVIGIAQLSPPGQVFVPPVQVFFDLPAPETPFSYVAVEEWDPTTGAYVPRPEKGWVLASGMKAVASLDHFCTVILTKPVPGTPQPPAPVQFPEPPPSYAEVTAKANAEAKTELAQNKQLAETYKAAAKDDRVALVTRTRQNEVAAKASAAQKSKDLASRNAKAAADRKIADLKERKAKALAETKAIEKQNRADQAQANREAAAREQQASQQRQRDQWAARQRMQEQQQAQQQRQQEAQQERQQRPQPQVKPTPGFFDQPARFPQEQEKQQQKKRPPRPRPTPDEDNPNNPNQ